MSKEKQEPITHPTKMLVFSKNSRFAKINAFSYLDERSLNKLVNKKLSHSLPQTNKDEDNKNQEIHICFSPSQDSFLSLKKLMLKINPEIVFSNEMDNFSANILTFDRLTSKWDEYLLDKEFIEKLSTDQKIARLVRKVNQKCLELLAGTMTKMTTDSYELFTRTAQKRLALGESIQNITKELANLSSYQSEYIRNTLLK
ncbi:MAG: hypothetical protein HYX60_00270, partial [Legionella longbeachae]|nr:hypothetical protein [Legionella longbeachae]